MTEPFQPLPEAAPFPLVDCHVHLGPSDTGELYYPHLTGEEYLDLMAAAGVEQAWAFAPLRADGYLQANAELRSWSTTTGGRIRPFARLRGPQLPPAREIWLLRRKLRTRLLPPPRWPERADDLAGYAGIKLLPLLDGLPPRQVLRLIADAGLPVLVHAGERCPPKWLARHLLPVLPGPVIFAHLGSFPCAEQLLVDAVALAGREPRLFLDTSGAWVAGFLRYALARVPEKILFGSDAPLTHPLVAWRQVASTAADPGLLERVGRLNALECLA